MLDVNVPPNQDTALIVDRIVATADGSTLVVERKPTPCRLHVPATPDQRRARRFLATARRIDRVVIELRGSVVSCTIIGQRIRRPFHAPVPLAVGLGLGELGVPLRLGGVAG